MATNIAKSLNPAPQSIEDAAAGVDGIEVIMPPEDDEEGEMAVIEITVAGFDANLAEEMDANAMQTLASDLVYDIDNDKMSRKDWEKAYVDGLKLLGLQYEERTEPWDGACGVFHPMITEAVVRFQSEAITETFPAQGPVRTKIVGKETPVKKEAAKRVEHDMNYELVDVMREYRPEHERMLWSLPATGSAFKKVYYDPSFGRQVSIFVPAEDMLLPYGTSDLDTASRVTHVMRKTKNDIVKLQNAGFYRDCLIDDAPTPDHEDIKEAKDKETGFNDINDERHVLYECHVDLDLKGYEDRNEAGEATGIALPYVVTIVKGTNEILSIRRNWREEDELKRKRQHFVHYQYIPGFGAYGFGLFHLIGGFAKSATSIMRQLVDAGTLSNLPGGMKSKGMRIKGDDTPIAPGEWRDVDVGSGTMRDNILPLPYKEPSATLYNLLNTIVEEGRRFAATADMKVSDMSAQAPVGTTLALLERQLKVMTAIQARLHYTMKQELRLLADIIRDYTDDDYEYDPEGDTDRHAKKTDYRYVEIIPVSDPNASTMSQRIVQYQAVVQLAATAPDIYNLPYLHRGMLDVLGIKNADKLVPLPEDMRATDPVAENMAALKGEPIKAFRTQDHESHIRVHMAAMQDPIIMQIVGQNPRAPQIQAAMTAHLAEHVGFAYQQKIEQQLGFALPDTEEKMDPEIERKLAGMQAQAAQQVLQKSQQMAAQQAAAQAAQDPVIQMQQKELGLRERELEIKEKELLVKATEASDKLELAAKTADQKNDVDTARVLIDMQTAGVTDTSQQTALDALKAQDEARRADEAHQQRLNAAARQAEMSQAAQAQGLQHKDEAHRQGIEQKAEAHREQLKLKKKQAAVPAAPDKDKKE